MRKDKICAVIVFILLFFTFSYSEINLSGNIFTDNRFRLEDNTFSWNEIQLISKLNLDIGNGHIYSETEFKSIGFPNILNSTDLQDTESINPLMINIRETYIDFYKFVLKNLDIRVGKQRIAWGTADKLNPTDNLNPDDLEDIMDFGRKLGSNSVKLTYYLGDYSLVGVVIPIFKPAVLPSDEWASAFFSSLPVPEGLILQSYSDTVILPKRSFEESSMFAVKFSGNLFNYDLSLSYFNGRDDIPLINNVIITSVSPTAIDVNVEMIYPKMQVIGADMSGEIGKIGVWGEAACFIPEKVIMITTMNTYTETTVALDSKPYYKYVVGMDYTFKNGLYINGQYLHGFIHEREEDNLEDYIILGMEKKFFDDDLKIKIGLGSEIKDFNKIKDNSAIMILPEISYIPMDNGEINLGAYFINGEDNTNFGKVKKNDEIYIKFKYSF